MPDATRPTPASSASPDGPPEATIESLLVAGLDLYFAGDYERAIHTWTRVLFLDRGHSRARAYIERARRLQAERQRQADALVHEATAAFEAGDRDRARRLVEQAERQGSADPLLLALRERLDRIGTAGQQRPPAGLDLAAATARVRQPRPVPVGRRALWGVVGVCLLAMVVALAWPGVIDWATHERHPELPPAAPADVTSLPVPRASDLLLARAEGLYSRGHLHEALEVLEVIRIDDPRRTEADRLKAEIQRVLLAGAVPEPASGPRVPTASSPR